MLDKEQIAAIRSNLEKFILENYGKSSRGIGVSVSQGNDTIVEYAHGEIDELNFRYSINTIYDLASLTKPLVTALLTMRLLERGKIALEDNIFDLGIKFSGTTGSSITVKSLLTHTSGLIPDYPCFTVGRDRESYIKCISLIAENAKPYTKEEYSDLNYILLGFILENIFGCPLDEAASREIFDPIGLKETGFNPQSQKDVIAPTEVTKDRGLVWGKVHDEKAYWLGGVSGHAGLFSSVPDLSKMLKALGEGRIISRKTLKGMISPANTYVGGTFSLGWMVKVPRPLNPSPSFGFSAFLGDLADYGVYGHTGFTGTSICIDPIKDIRIIVLTNRVYPTRENQEILRFRRRFHNLVFGQLYSALDDDNGVS